MISSCIFLQCYTLEKQSGHKIIQNRKIILRVLVFRKDSLLNLSSKEPFFYTPLNYEKKLSAGPYPFFISQIHVLYIRTLGFEAQKAF